MENFKEYRRKILYINQEIGKFGEDIATKYLQKKGYTIIERNFSCKQGEIDIIAKDFSELVFIEVKTRTSKEYGNPAEAVNEIKKKHIETAAEYYLYKTKQQNKFIRFDVIEVLMKNGYYTIKHIEQIK